MDSDVHVSLDANIPTCAPDGARTFPYWYFSGLLKIVLIGLNIANHIFKNAERTFERLLSFAHHRTYSWGIDGSEKN